MHSDHTAFAAVVGILLEAGILPASASSTASTASSASTFTANCFGFGHSVTR